MVALETRRTWDCGDPFCHLCNRPEPPDYDDDDDYGYDEDDEESYGHQIHTAPWKADGRVTSDQQLDIDRRGGIVSYTEAWPILAEHRQINVVEMAADFWTLHGIAANVLGQCSDRWVDIFVREAARALDGLTRYLDDIFVSYCAAAIGGELRHHPAIGERAISDHRKTAWTQWRYLQDLLGPELYKDAAYIFRDFQTSGFGGEPWAIAAEVVYARLTHKIPPSVFVDRVMDLEHNGGCFLNKLQWAQDTRKFASIETIRHSIGPAHAAVRTDWNTLLFYGSADVAHLFSEYREAVNGLHRSMGIRSVPLYRPQCPDLWTRQEIRRMDRSCFPKPIPRLDFYSTYRTVGHAIRG